MSTKDIRTHQSDTQCEVCGRTLLRGERAEIYVNGAARRLVCELCKTRALHEGWVREGTEQELIGRDNGINRRRSLLGRLRGRREQGREASLEDLEPDELGWAPVAGPDTAADEGPNMPAPHRPGPPAAPPPSDPGRRRSDRDRRAVWPARPAHPERWEGERSADESYVAPVPRRPSRRPPSARGGARQIRDQLHEPRHVHAVPAREDQKMAAALELFNRSAHRRTISGVARSLGLPSVSVLAHAEHPSLVHVVVSWELCWYRYEVDLADEIGIVRTDAQGTELHELTGAERQGNARADESGALTLR
jgi:hypothetical protein